MKKDTTFFNDNYSKVYERGDAVSQIEFLEDINDIFQKKQWIELDINDTFPVAISDGPLFANQILTDYNIYGDNLDAVLSTITDGSSMGYEKGSQVMLGHRKGSTKVYYLLSQKAYDAYVGLVGSECTAFRRKGVEQQVKSLNEDIATLPKKKGMLLQLNSGDCKGDASHGSNYNPLNPPKMLYGLTDKFEEKYPGYSFEGGGYIEHSIVWAKFAFPEQAEDILSLYDKKIAEKTPLFDLSDAVPTVSFYTSEAGETAATLSAYLEKDNKYRIKIGSIVKVYHKGKSTENDVIEAADEIFAKFRDLAASVAELIKIDIDNPINAMLNIGLGPVGLNKLQLLSAIEEFKDLYGEEPEGVTAQDVFYTLQRALYNMAQKDSKIEDKEESLLKLLAPGFSWETYDSSVLTVTVAKAES